MGISWSKLKWCEKSGSGSFPFEVIEGDDVANQRWLNKLNNEAHEVVQNVQQQVNPINVPEQEAINNVMEEDNVVGVVEDGNMMNFIEHAPIINNQPQQPLQQQPQVQNEERAFPTPRSGRATPHRVVPQRKKKLNLVCGTCRKILTTMGGYRNHLRRHAWVMPRNFVCSFENCEQRFETGKDLRRHQRVHTHETPYKCTADACQKEFSRRDNFVRHLKNVHLKRLDAEYLNIEQQIYNSSY